MTHRSIQSSPSLLRARVANLAAQTHLDALNGDPAAKLWAEVMDAFLDSLKNGDWYPPPKS